ncbi:hypothetical protein MKX01_035726 [Papaver californicum]|nr:hypothetical protein MKX01_035726 [Papaver californicum]
MGSEGAILFDLNNLPERCISTILSLTSPVDACKSSIVSSTFHLALDSDVVWEKFLPLDYKKILLRSVYSTVKPLSEHKLSQGWLEKFKLRHGTKSYRVSEKVAQIKAFGRLSITNLKICGKIKTSMLSLETTYAAYLIVKFEEWAYGLDSIPSELLLGENDGNSSCKGFAYLSRANDKKKQQMKQLFFTNRMQMMRSKVIMEEDQGKEMRVLRDRNDGWMEIELGEFYIRKDGKNDHSKEVIMSLMEVKGGQLKGGLVVHGIEVRPRLR